MKLAPFVVLSLLACAASCSDADTQGSSAPNSQVATDTQSEPDAAGSTDAGVAPMDVPASDVAEVLPAPDAFVAPDVGDPATIVRWEPLLGDYPMPNDFLINEETGLVELPTFGDLSPAELALREWLNTQDGWSATSQLTVNFSGPVDPATVSWETVQVWRWGQRPEQLTDDEATWTLSEDGTRVTVDPKREGWRVATTYVGLVRGGTAGVKDVDGRPVEASAGFRWARSDEAVPAEKVRIQLAPLLDFFDSVLPLWDQIERDEIAVLWPFTVMTKVELLMDRTSQRVPTPFDLLWDPDTGRISLEHAPWDTPLEGDAKTQLNELDGFGLTSRVHIDFSAPLDPAFATVAEVSVYEVASGEELPVASVEVKGDSHLIVAVEDTAVPLKRSTRYAVVVRDGLRGEGGVGVVAQSLGRMLVSEHPIFEGGASTIGSLSAALAERVELVRARVAPLLDVVGRDGVVAAWPFTTMNVFPGLEAAARKADSLDLDVTPTIDEVDEIADGFLSGPADRAAAFDVLFPNAFAIDPIAASVRAVYAPRLNGVARLVWGHLPSPYFLDPVTRRWRDNDAHEVQQVPFLMTVPRQAQGPVPVVVFAHAIVTDRRFLLTIAGALAERGMAAVAIDLPFHGERTACVDDSLVALPNFLPPLLQSITNQTDPLIQLPPCVSGDKATCAPTGECLDEDGNPEPFNTFVRVGDNVAIMDMEVASGAAFLDLSDMAYLKDRFLQALVDLGSLRRSLQTVDWSSVAGVELKTDRMRFAGQSLGSIVGLTFTSVDDTFDRMAFNVPGGDLVELFMNSTYFEGQIERFLTDIHLEADSYEFERLLDIARWLIDSVDPQAVSHVLTEGGREAMLQMDQGDLIIPNMVTRTVQRVSGLPMLEYPSPLHADLIVPVIGLPMLNDLADFLEDGELP